MTKKTEYVRKTAEYEDTFDVVLTPAEVAERKEDLLDQLDRMNELEEELSNFKKDMGARKSAVESKIESLRRSARSARETVKGKVEEYLTKGNEIERVFEGKVIGKRTAKPEELQETMSFAKPDQGEQADHSILPEAPEEAPFEPSWDRGK